MSEDAEYVTCLVPVAFISDIYNPLEADPWGCGLTSAHIDAAFSLEIRRSEPVVFGEADPFVHAARICWLVENGWNDEIVFCVGTQDDYIPAYPVLDGNHRLAAAILRGDDHILVSPDGDLDVAERLFSGVCADLTSAKLSG